MYVRKFRAFSPAAFGVDIDLEKLAEGARELPNLAQSVAEALPFADGSFDVILLHEVIEHVRSDREAVAEAYRCLRPGGRVVIFAPNRLYPLETHGFYLGKRYVFRLAPIIPWLPDRLRQRFCPHVRTYRAADIRRLFAGLPGEYRRLHPGLPRLRQDRQPPPTPGPPAPRRHLPPGVARPCAPLASATWWCTKKAAG